ncbi:hypothetical protein [Streptomyces sp. NBC_00286]|uniref:hypothetical protein n=1 Tax=Streptomyces sp. NBC_00286 TaxID=2975701 RepID=UPI003FA71D30
MTATGTQYAVLAAGPEEDWPQQRRSLEVALAHLASWPPSQMDIVFIYIYVLRYLTAGLQGVIRSEGSGNPVEQQVSKSDDATASSVAATPQALAPPSRLLTLTALRHSPYPVGELAATVGMEQAAVSAGAAHARSGHRAPRRPPHRLQPVRRPRRPTP